MWGVGREGCIRRAGRIGIMRGMGCGVLSGKGGRGGSLMLWLVLFGYLLFEGVRRRRYEYGWAGVEHVGGFFF